jgi:formylglycine-generating enzyme required for sulfatase activity
MTKPKQEPIFSQLDAIVAKYEHAGKNIEDDRAFKQQVNTLDGEPPKGVGSFLHEAAQSGAAVSSRLPQELFEPLTKPAEAAIFGPPSEQSDLSTSLDSFFVLIPPGSFLMGSPDYEAGRSPEETIHEVTITKPFYMQKVPVTQGLWKAVMGENPAFFQNGLDDLPVESVSWWDCRQFLKNLNSLAKGVYRLPTEAEWEYGCRAQSATAFSNGEIAELFCAMDPVLAQTGWYCANSGRKTHPVGRKKPNDWGLFDMHGNVAEWCLDWYGDYGNGAGIDPLGPKAGAGKVIRGGSWFGSAKNCRAAARLAWPPNLKSDFIGFRLVKETS